MIVATDYYKKPDLAQVLIPVISRPANNREPIPETLTDIINNVIRGVALVARDGVPTDRQMKALQIALDILRSSPALAESLGRHNPFRPTIAAELAESSSERQTIARLRTMYKQAQLPTAGAPSEPSEPSTHVKKTTKTGKYSKFK